VDTLAAMLEEDGLFAQRFPGFEYRSQQVEMLRAVATSLSEQQHLMVEAGTGTGKSIAYLLPAVSFGHLNGERVVVSTNTLNLQDQLFLKDVPDLQALLPFDFRLRFSGCGAQGKEQLSLPETACSASQDGRQLARRAPDAG
jgi:Rad3-related DNA helicase